MTVQESNCGSTTVQNIVDLLHYTCRLITRILYLFPSEPWDHAPHKNFDFPIFRNACVYEIVSRPIWDTNIGILVYSQHPPTFKTQQKNTESFELEVFLF